MKGMLKDYEVQLMALLLPLSHWSVSINHNILCTTTSPLLFSYEFLGGVLSMQPFLRSWHFFLNLFVWYHFLNWLKGKGLKLLMYNLKIAQYLPSYFGLLYTIVQANYLVFVHAINGAPAWNGWISYLYFEEKVHDLNLSSVIFQVRAQLGVKDKMRYFP